MVDTLDKGGTAGGNEHDRRTEEAHSGEDATAEPTVGVTRFLFNDPITPTTQVHE